jgi:Tol biopolymer transport system component
MLSSLPKTTDAVVTKTENSPSVQSTLTPMPDNDPTLAPTITSVFTTTPTSQQPTATPAPTFTLTPELSPTLTGGGSGQIAFVSDRTGEPEIYLINLDGTGLQKITDIAEGACQPAWSPDGMRLVIVSPCSKNKETYRGSSLIVMNADGSGLTPLIPPVPGGDFDNLVSDGKRLLLLRCATAIFHKYMC